MKKNAKWVGIVCSIKECDRPAHCRGVCHSHYQCVIKGTAIVPITPIKSSNPRLCAVPTCKAAAFAHDICHTHYKAARQGTRGGDNTCTVAGCDFQHVARGYCAAHYEAWRVNREYAKVQSALGETDLFRKDGA